MEIIINVRNSFRPRELGKGCILEETMFWKFFSWGKSQEKEDSNHQFPIAFFSSEPGMDSILEETILILLSSWIPNPGVLCSKPLGGSKVDSAFHPYEVDKMGTRNSWELSGKK